MKMRELYQPQPRERELDIHNLTKKMLADGYYGHNTFEPVRAEDAILVAAHDSTVENWLSTRAYAFWGILEYKYRVWRARRDLKRPYKNADGDSTVSKNF
jgi:hypothetical protein